MIGALDGSVDDLPIRRARTALLIGGILSIAPVACSSAEEPAASTTLPLPTGASREPSGFATILSAPPRPLPDAPPTGPPAQADSPAYRMSMANPDAATMAEVNRIMTRIRARERGNFVQTIVIRNPRPRYAIYFRRDAAATLARYTRNPNIVARQGGLTSAALQPLVEEWLAKFRPDRIASGGGAQPALGIVEIDVNSSKSQFAALAKKRGWVVPPQVVLRFAPEVDETMPIAREAAPFVRAFPRARYAAGLVPAIALYGRLVLRNGCLQLSEPLGATQGLAVFARGTQLVVDEQGYLAVRSDAKSVPSARIGERVVFGVAPVGRDADPDIVALHAKCGPGKRVGVGLPTSAVDMYAPWFLVDQYAKLRRIPRQAAWDKIKACRMDAAVRPEPVRDANSPSSAEEIECSYALGNVPPPPPPARR